MKYQNNIKLDYFHTFIRNINFTQGFWLLFLIQVKGFDLFEVGMLETVFHITSLSMEVPTGIIADVLGRKFSRVLGILSYFIYIGIMIFSPNFYLILIGFIFCGLSFTFESGSGEALVYDSLKLDGVEDRFMKVNGNKEVIYQFASSISLFLAGWIISINYNLSWYLTAIFYLLALVVILLMKETPLIEKIKKISFRKMLYNQYVVSTKTIFGNRRLLYLIIIGAMFAAPITSLFLFLPEHFTSLGFTKWEIGLLLGVHAMFAAFGGYFAHRLEKKYKERKILYFVPLFIAVSLWLMLIDSIIVIPFILLGFLDSIFYVVLGDYMNKIIPSEIRATALSFSGLMFSLVMIIIFPLIGLIGKSYSLWVGFSVLALITTLFYLFLLVVLKGTHLNKI